jgi:hypothetical protein
MLVGSTSANAARGTMSSPKSSAVSCPSDVQPDEWRREL